MENSENIYMVAKNIAKEGMQLMRKSFVMPVNPHQHKEYQRRHDLIWPEVKSLLKLHGVHNYSIFLDVQSSQLFGYVEIENEARWQAIADKALCQKWWAYMAEIMPTNADLSPKYKVLVEVFHLD